MPKLKKLSGKEVISILNQFGFEVIDQRGSHVKLRRTKDNFKQTLLIPNHKEIDTGTLRANCQTSREIYFYRRIAKTLLYITNDSKRISGKSS